MPSVSASWLAANAPSSVVELAEHVVERAGRDRAIARVTGQCPGVQVDPRELGVVVEHLLEVRDEPVRRPSSSGGSRHRAGRGSRRRPSRRGSAGRPRAAGRRRWRDAAEQVLDRHRLRELGRPAPAAVDRVERGLDRGRRGPGAERWLGSLGGRLRRGCCSTSCSTSRPPAASTSARCSARPARRPRGPGGTTASRGAARPGSRCRRRTAGRRASGRPTSASRPAGHRLDGGHVDLVEVGPLLAVDLDRDEVLVEVARASARARTTRAPSRGTSGRPRSRSIRKIGRSSSFARASASGPHGNQSTGLLRVLEQVRAGLAGEAVGHHPMVRGRRTRMVRRAHRRGSG